MTFPTRLKAFREQGGLTREQLAQCLQVPTEQVEAWESGENGAIRLKQEISGTKKSGLLSVNGTMVSGRWQYQEFKVRFHDGKELNLLKKQGKQDGKR